MRKLVISTFLSLDGVMEDPGGSEGTPFGGWTIPFWNDETAAFKGSEMAEADALLLGRITYTAFADAWAGSTEPGSEEMNGLTKHVATRTLATLPWANSQRLEGEVIDAVLALKRRPGRNILVYGSAMLAGTLLKAGLVDELRLLVYPIALGHGKRLFPAGMRLPFRLVVCDAFSTGVVGMVYGAG